MFGGFFNRMYLGNARKPDFKKEDLPSNRIRLFFDVLGVRFGKLIQLNLLYLIFLIPAIIWTSMNIAVLSNPDLQVDASIITIYLTFLIPCLVIAGPATAGMYYVLRNWARDEHAWLFSDFKDCALQNWKQSMAIMLLNGIALLVFYINVQFYAAMELRNPLFFILRFLIIGVGIIYAMMNLYIFPMLITYKLTIRQILQNALIFAIVRLPYSFLFLLINLFPLILFMILLFYPIFSPYIILLFYLVIGFSFIGLINASYTNAVFDKYINIRLEGVEINKGLRKEEEDDE